MLDQQRGREMKSDAVSLEFSILKLKDNHKKAVVASLFTRPRSEGALYCVDVLIPCVAVRLVQGKSAANAATTSNNSVNSDTSYCIACATADSLAPSNSIASCALAAPFARFASALAFNHSSDVVVS